MPTVQMRGSGLGDGRWFAQGHRPRWGKQGGLLSVPALGSGLGVSGRGQEEEGLLLHPCPITLIICPMYCSLLILNSRYQISLPQSAVYLRRKLD